MMMFRNPHATGRFSIVAGARSSEKKRMKRWESFFDDGK